MKNILIDIIKHTPTMIRKVFCDIALLADSTPTIAEKLKYFIYALITLSPVAWFIEGISKWFLINIQFTSFVIACVIINLFIGGWYHFRMGTFSYEQFIVRNGIMVVVLIFGYSMLEMLKITMGSNMLAEGFGVIIKVSTLLYPMSKSLKNLFILSNKQFPPAFIMERLYNFEKTGNLKDLFPEDYKDEE